MNVWTFQTTLAKCLLMQALQVCFAHFAKNEAQKIAADGGSHGPLNAVGCQKMVEEIALSCPAAKP